jgi:cobalamin biosynthesis Mg chelatase CobN
MTYNKSPHSCTLLLPSGAVLTSVLWEPTLPTPLSTVYPTITLTELNELRATAMVIMWEPSNLIAEIQTSSPAIPTGISSLTTQASSGSSTNPFKTTASTSSSSSRISTGVSPGNTTGSASSNGLSTGAKAGIAVGIVALFILIVLMALFYFQRRRKTINGTSGENPLKPSSLQILIHMR